jgi:hypothetical protein
VLILVLGLGLQDGLDLGVAVERERCGLVEVGLVVDTRSLAAVSGLQSRSSLLGTNCGREGERRRTKLGKAVDMETSGPSRPQSVGATPQRCNFLPLETGILITDCLKALVKCAGTIHSPPRNLFARRRLEKTDLSPSGSRTRT